jgi:DNA-binding IclR family transcriptional regulator
MSENNHIQSIQRAVAVLRSFNEREPELGVMALSRQLGLHKSTVSRILTTLQAEGLVSQNPETEKYRLGVGLVSLAGVALGRLSVRGVALPHLEQLTEQTQETSSVITRDGRECVNIGFMSSPQPLRHVSWIGRRSPLHCTASGKLFLAFMDAAERDVYLNTPLEAFTAQTITSADTLRHQLDALKTATYCVVADEFQDGLTEVAAPIRDHTGQLVGTAVLQGPTFRIGARPMAQIIDTLLAATDKISIELGYRGI